MSRVDSIQVTVSTIHGSKCRPGCGMISRKGTGSNMHPWIKKSECVQNCNVYDVAFDCLCWTQYYEKLCIIHMFIDAEYSPLTLKWHVWVLWGFRKVHWGFHWKQWDCILGKSPSTNAHEPKWASLRHSPRINLPGLDWKMHFDMILISDNTLLLVTWSSYRFDFGKPILIGVLLSRQPGKSLLVQYIGRSP